MNTSYANRKKSREYFIAGVQSIPDSRRIYLPNGNKGIRSVSPAQRLTGFQQQSASLISHGRKRARRPERQLLEHVVAAVFGVNLIELRMRRRGCATVAFARQVAMYLAHTSYGFNLSEVGRIFERDRTTVAHACCVIEDRRDDPNFDRALEALDWGVQTYLYGRQGSGR